MKKLSKSLLHLATCSAAIGISAPLIIGATAPNNSVSLNGPRTLYISKDTLSEGSSELYWASGYVGNWGFDGIVPDGFEIGDPQVGNNASCRIKWTNLEEAITNFDLRLKFDTNSILIHVIFVEANKFVNFGANEVGAILVGSSQNLQLGSGGKQFTDYNSISITATNDCVSITHNNQNNWTITGKKKGSAKLLFGYNDTNNLGYGVKFPDPQDIIITNDLQDGASMEISGPDSLMFSVGSTVKPTNDSYKYAGAKTGDVGFKLAYPAFAGGTDPGKFNVSFDSTSFIGQINISKSTTVLDISSYPVLLNYYTDAKTIVASKAVVINIFSAPTFTYPQDTMLVDLGAGGKTNLQIGKEFYIDGTQDQTGRFWLGNEDNTGPYTGGNFVLDDAGTAYHGRILKIINLSSSSATTMYVNWVGPNGVQRIAQKVTVYADQITGPASSNNWMMNVGDTFVPTSSDGKTQIPYATSAYKNGKYSATSSDTKYTPTVNAQNVLNVTNTAADAGNTTITVNYTLSEAKADWQTTTLQATLVMGTWKYTVSGETELLTAFNEDNQAQIPISKTAYKISDPHNGANLTATGAFAVTQTDNTGNPISPSIDNNNMLKWTLPSHSKPDIANGYITLKIDYLINNIIVSSMNAKLYVCTINQTGAMNVYAGTSSGDSATSGVLTSTVGLASVPNFAKGTNQQFAYDVTFDAKNYIGGTMIGSPALTKTTVFPYTTGKTYAATNNINVNLTLTFDNAIAYTITRICPVNILTHTITGDDIVLFSTDENSGQGKQGNVQYTHDAPGTAAWYTWRLVNSDGTVYDPTGIHIDGSTGKLHYNESTSGAYQKATPTSWTGKIQLVLTGDHNAIVAESPLTIIALDKINFSDVSVYPNGSYISQGTINLPDQFKTAFNAYPYSATKPSAGGPYFNVATVSGANVVLSGQAKDTAPKIKYNVRSAGDYTATYPYNPLNSSSHFNFTNNHGTTVSIPIAPSIYSNSFQITGGFGKFDNQNASGIGDFVYIHSSDSNADYNGPTFTVGSIPTPTSSYNWSPEFQTSDTGIQFTSNSDHTISTNFSHVGATGSRTITYNSIKNTKDNKYAIMNNTVNYTRIISGQEAGPWNNSGLYFSRSGSYHDVGVQITVIKFIANSDYTSGNNFNMHTEFLIYINFYYKNFSADSSKKENYTLVGQTYDVQYAGITTSNIGKKIIFLVGNLDETGVPTNHTTDLVFNSQYITRHIITWNNSNSFTIHTQVWDNKYSGIGSGDATISW